MDKKFTVIIEQDEGGYFIAEAPELKGCHTQAKCLDTLMKRIKEFDRNLLRAARTAISDDSEAATAVLALKE